MLLSPSNDVTNDVTNLPLEKPFTAAVGLELVLHIHRSLRVSQLAPPNDNGIGATRHFTT
jgi:hypothetical protein